MEDIAVCWVTPHCTNPADAQRLLAEHSGEVVPLRAGQDVGSLDERVPTLMTTCPGRLPERGIKGRECRSTETMVRGGICRIQNPVEHGAFSAYDGRHLHDASGAGRELSARLVLRGYGVLRQAAAPTA